jgi:hypothetical protein
MMKRATTRENNLIRIRSHLRQASMLVDEMLKHADQAHVIDNELAGGVRVLEKLKVIEVFDMDQNYVAITRSKI